MGAQGTGSGPEGSAEGERANIRRVENGLRRSDEKIKLQRAQGGCHGARRRRRTRQAAKSFGELQASVDPEISEWGNPAGAMPGHCMMNP